MNKIIFINVIKEYFSTYLKDIKFDLNGNLENDLGIDSLDYVELIIYLEEKFNIVIPDNKYFNTINEIIRFLDKK